MDPCPFVRITVGNLALKFPVASKPAFTGVHPSCSPCYCKIKLKNFPTQLATIPLVAQESGYQFEDQVHACFNLNKSEFDRIVEKSLAAKKGSCLKVEIYTGRMGSSCGLDCGNLLGSVSVPLNFKGLESRGVTAQNGWVGLGDRGSKGSAAKLHLRVKAEPDPRFVFQFDGEPECSPQVFQVNGNVRQAVFTCTFSFRNAGERNLRSSSLSEPSTSGSWLSSLRLDKEKTLKERKGWSITIHDLSGSPVAAASMVTPFVPSPGSNRVSQSNPGAWLILRPGQGTWTPWGRLEAWRERGSGDRLGYRFELLPNGGIDNVPLASSSISTKNGGKFVIDISSGPSPMTTPSSSFDSGTGSVSSSELGYGSWASLLYRGFVMSSTVAGSGKCSKPEVEVGVQHVTCKEDAAAFVALAAAMDLSMDACRLFSQKLRKELRQDGQEHLV
ncbi:hypothetical protein RJ640_018592 [Escallonia rubra]|uniref:Formin-like protein 18 n=1 Tax=Escallonia rubra TaxID=112253 RepID=A0AA88RR80_9ASTE|nr:hypothetical protein RJ640_018592 [Escallonia rubra]